MDDRMQVSEGGRGELRLHAESPHLVSMGSGRLSTGVTLHPLPPGRVTLGSGRHADIPVQGTGVEDIHCHIENIGGIVTIHPVAEMTAIDGSKISSSIRLTQGSMICIGRSNYLRFNHPAEARLMKSILPNKRISVAPINFAPGDKELEAFQRAVDSLERKPPVAPRSRFLTQEYDVPNRSNIDDLSSSLQSCVLGKVSKFESLAHANNPATKQQMFSPKVFPAGSATVNAPACDVLGPDRAARRKVTIPVDIIRTQNSKNNVSDYIANFNSAIMSVNKECEDVCYQSKSGKPRTDYEDIMSKSVVGLPGNPLGNGNVMIYDDFPSLERPSGSNTPSSKLFKSAGLMSTSLIIESQQDRSKASAFESVPLANFNSSPTHNGFNGSYMSSRANGVNIARSRTPNSSESPSPSPAHRPYNTLPHKQVSSLASSSGRKTPVNHAESFLNATLRQRVGSTSPSLSGSNCSLEDLAIRNTELEEKRKHAVVQRIKEQEVERAERARLDEILTLCAEYERQAHHDRVPKPQPKSSRIKTNGSLPRDKRNPGSLSPILSPSRTSTSTDDIFQMFNFDPPNSLHSSPSKYTSSGNTKILPHYENVVLKNQPNGNKIIQYESLIEKSAGNSSTSSYINLESVVYGSAASDSLSSAPYENVLLHSPVLPGSPRTRIRTVPSAKEPVSLPREITHEVLENRLALAQYDVSDSSQKVNKSSHSSSSSSHGICTSTPTGANGVTASPKFRESPLLQNGLGFSPNLSSSDWNTPINSSKLLQPRKLDREKFILPLEEPMSSRNYPLPPENCNKIEDSEKREYERDSGVPASPVQETTEKSNDSSGKICTVEVEILQKEKSKILSAMTVLKGKVTDIQQQEDELEREIEMERALIEAELRTQSEKLRIEEGRLSSLRQRVAQLDADMEENQARQAQQQLSSRQNLDRVEREEAKLREELENCTDPNIRREVEQQLIQQHDILDSERKLFEDLEFRQLEEEAGWLAGREEVQRELTEVASRVAARQTRVEQLRSQVVSVGDSAQSEQQALQEQRAAYLQRLDQGRQRLDELDSRLEELARQGVFSIDSVHDVSSETDEDKPILIRKTSQDDLDRISRVTSGAPLDISDTGSLGRKTLESLKEIERNRQLHLAKQGESVTSGSLVIEQERRRVQQLKRRVADEVRAQWEEKRQREINCSSLTSVASEDSSLTSSDIHTESASGDDALGRSQPRNSSAMEEIQGPESPSVSEINSSQVEEQSNSSFVAEQQAQRGRLLEETRPLSDASSFEDTLSVRMRDKTNRLQQRPLTRYLPIRGESLNLRQHIESAGHQIELCPHVTLDSVSCRGVLHKMASKFHSWQKRWFVFDRSQRTFAYFSNRNSTKPRGGAYFQSIEEVYVDHLNSVKSPHPQLTFVVKTRERTYHLMAPSAEAMRIWVDVVFTGAEGYQEFEHGS